ncbi:hypothetical protein ACDZ94_26035 (plasmid) [Pseudomonas sp. UBT]|uniref:lipase family protein n=1 Tax=Pseudomonas sp. UBT TaxID=3239198 RepID=UPI003D80634E
MDRLSAAPYALLVMYAWDLCDINPRQIPPPIDPRINETGWNVVGFISGSDDILISGLGLRSTMLGASDDQRSRVCYGYVAQRNVQGQDQYVVAIRGTDGAQEWGDDLDFLMMNHPNPKAGLVDQGFWDIYRTMQFHGADGASPVPLALGISQLTAANPPMVLGHSLGSALATYLTLDLNLQGCKAVRRVPACLPRQKPVTRRSWTSSRLKSATTTSSTMHAMLCRPSQRVTYCISPPTTRCCRPRQFPPVLQVSGLRTTPCAITT